MKRMFLPSVCLLAIVSFATSCRTQDDAVRFFQSHSKEVDFRASGDSLLFANRDVGLQIRKSASGFRLVRLYGIKTGQDFLAPDSAEKSPNLFRSAHPRQKTGSCKSRM